VLASSLSKPFVENVWWLVKHVVVFGLIETWKSMYWLSFEFGVECGG